MRFAALKLSLGSSTVPYGRQSAPRPAACLERAATAEQLTFASAEEAVLAMLHALKTEDDASLLRILGPADEILSPESSAGENESGEHFVQKCRQMHRLIMEPDGTATFCIGSGIWPISIPLVHRGSSWYFDIETGKQEIQNRRIGENELAAIKACHELVNAQKENHSQRDYPEGPNRHSQRALATPAEFSDRLWKAGLDEAESSLGSIVALTAGIGEMENAIQELQPFHGYLFRALQGPRSTKRRGCECCREDGNLRRNFAFLAYPAEYQSSGVMTFLAGQDDVVYEKDLGRNTAEIAESVARYERDKTWQRAEAGLSL